MSIGLPLLRPVVCRSYSQLREALPKRQGPNGDRYARIALGDRFYNEGK